MKDRILMLIVGVLVGAIITTGVFLVINKSQQNQQQNMQHQRMQQFQNMMGDPNGINGNRRFRNGNTVNPETNSNSATNTAPQTITNGV
ncbi:MAG: hypothetical protein FWC53_00255 [Firmicutes bacterium]|nr:hypothetical protein [Bacillota bacterium]